MISIPHGAYELEILDLENKRIIFEEGHITEAFYPFSIKPKFSTLGSIIEVTNPNFFIYFTITQSVIY